LSNDKSLERDDDGLQNMYRRVCGPEGWDEELLERGEKPVGAGDEPFRVEVVGSNPAGPTTDKLTLS